MFGTITHFPSLNIFHTICRPHTCHPVQLFLFFFSSVPKLTEPSKKKKPEQTEPVKEEEEEEKKKELNSQPMKRKGKKSQKVVKSCGWVLFVNPLYVFNYIIVIELWIMETENSQNVFSVSIIHNSKIRELSDGNRVMETELSCAKWILSYASHHFWVINYENWKLSYENRLSKQPLIFHCVDLMTSESTQDICRCSYNK